ncbi:TRAP transporter small permease [Tepidamorphus sp. 3E244]|uniref:TRAP transporter small permease n=1 Tax=Tepidamorphus sp. 3E244 TaxID=3385498 RepID=UPI0038FC81C9
MIAKTRNTLEWLLEWFLIVLMVTLTIVVVVSVIWRLAGQSFSWYDEVASIQLSWITYYGAALAALKRKHIGFDSVLLSLPPNLRAAGIIFAEGTVIAFFAIMAWAGMQVLQVLAGDTLISLTWMPIQVTQSVIPIGAVLFIICELLSLPEYWKLTMSGISMEHAEIEEEVESEMQKAGNA